MKHILQRVWKELEFSSVVLMAALTVWTAVSVWLVSKPFASASVTNTVDPIHATNGLVLAEDVLMLTNWASTNLVNYPGFVTNLSVYQTYRTNLTIEWVVEFDRKQRNYELGLRSDGMVVWREVKK